MLDVHGSESLTPLVGYGVRMIHDKLQQDSMNDSTLLFSLKFLLDLAANTLDNDLDIVRNYKEHDKEQKELPSTLHIFVPHRDRGKPSNKKKKNQDQRKQVPDRQLVNSIAEILIWSRTVQAANNNKTFMDCYESFLLASANKDDTKIKSNLHILQTIIRNLRKELNGFARTQGFMLTDQFQLNKGPLNLTRLAVKKNDDTVMKLIRARHEHGKTDKYSSVNELILFAVDAHASPEQLQELHVGRLKSTLEHLRG